MLRIRPFLQLFVAQSKGRQGQWHPRKWVLDGAVDFNKKIRQHNTTVIFVSSFSVVNRPGVAGAVL